MIFLCAIPLFPLPTSVKIWLAKKHGYDGIEILVTAKNKHRLKKISEEVHSSGLGVSFHQPWSLAENPTHGVNKILDIIGVLPETDYTLGNFFQSMPADVPVTLYADRIREEWNHPRKRFQTCSVFNKNLEFKLSYKEFCKEVLWQKAKVTFDTQQVLEYYLNIQGVEGLLGYNRDELLDILIHCWNDLGGKENVEEIHWNDSSPSLGHTAGRNVFLGSGVLPLDQFAEYILKDGWDYKNKTVVPEVGSPLTLILKGGEVRNKTAEYFQ